MLTHLEKNRLLKISLLFLVVLVAVTLLSIKNYSSDLKKIIPDSKKGKALIENNISTETLDNLNITGPYQIKVFANTFKKPVFIAPGPFNGILVADQGLNGAYQLVDNTGDDVADFNTEILNGFNNISTIFWQNPFLYIVDTTGVYKYDYDALEAKVSDRTKIVDSGSYENQAVLGMVVVDKDIYIFVENGEVYRANDSGYLELIQTQWPICLEGGSALDFPCLVVGSSLASDLSHVTRFEPAVINSSLFPAEDQGDVLSVLTFDNGDTKVVKFEVTDGRLVSMSDFITGWSENNLEPSSIEFSSEGQLYISDKKNRSIYKITKINN